MALLAMFLPGFLLALAVLPAWHALAGINAAVVGLLAALYDPVGRHAIRGAADVAICIAGLLMLASGRVPVSAIVAGCVGAAMPGR